MEENIEKIHQDVLTEIDNASERAHLDSISIKYLGRKGVLTQFLRGISKLPAKERPEAGKLANILKSKIDKAIQDAIKAIDLKTLGTAHIDVSLSGRPYTSGSLHPVTSVENCIKEIFARLGFEVAEGPEIETDYYNFEALNISKNHPARDMQDTFYVSDNIVLRTHTSPIQIRIMEKNPPPVRVIAPGKVFRCDSDITHTPMFHQIEGLFVDKGVSFGDLKGVLTTFIHEIFDNKTKLRFRPSFFPFTEPSAEVDILCVICRGKGCRVCSHTGWLEIIGSGMVHPAVFENVGYDTSIYTGFAFGMGVERITMLKYGIDDIRKFYENDIRFLGQF